MVELGGPIIGLQSGHCPGLGSFASESLTGEGFACKLIRLLAKFSSLGTTESIPSWLLARSCLEFTAM